MALRIFTNLSSLNSQRALQISSDSLGGSLQRIASGIRLQRSGDDIAAMSVSENLRGDAIALKQGSRNLNDGLALINMLDGALQEQSGILIRLREISAQSATGTIGDTERATLNLEFSALRSEFDRIAQTTEFNDRKLLDGSLSTSSSKTTVLQIGSDSGTNNRFNLNQELSLNAVTSSNMNFSTSNISTETSATKAMDSLSLAIDKLVTVRGRVGAVQNRLEIAFDALNSHIESINGGIATLRDADLAEEFAEMTKRQVLVQGAAAMIGQANLIPQSVLTLLQQ